MPTTSTKKRKTKPRGCLTWDEALARFEEHRIAENAAKRTVYSQRRHVLGLRGHLGPDVEPFAVDLSTLRDYTCALLLGAGRGRRPVSAATAANVVASLRSFFRFLAAEGLLAADPAERLERPHLPERRPKSVLTPKEVARVLGFPDTSTAQGLRDRAMLELLYVCGLRRNEALGLDLSDLDHHSRDLCVRHAKGRRPRVVPLPPSTYQSLVAYLDNGRPSFVRHHEDSTRALFLNRWGRRLNPIRVHLLFKAMRKALKLKKPLTPHRLRHACAGHLLQGGANLRVIQRLLGHAHLNTTAIYLHLDQAEIRRALLLHHPRERLDLGEP